MQQESIPGLPKKSCARSSRSHKRACLTTPCPNGAHDKYRNLIRQNRAFSWCMSVLSGPSCFMTGTTYVCACICIYAHVDTNVYVQRYVCCTFTCMHPRSSTCVRVYATCERESRFQQVTIHCFVNRVSQKRSYSVTLCCPRCFFWLCSPCILVLQRQTGVGLCKNPPEKIGTRGRSTVLTLSRSAKRSWGLGFVSAFFVEYFPTSQICLNRDVTGCRG